MSDPAYDSGVKADSIIDMLDDIHNVYIGESKYVRIPQPIDGIAPADTMKFSTSSKSRPESLLRSNIDSKNSSISRRTLSHRLSQVSDHANFQMPIDNQSRYVSRNKSSVTLKIDEAMDYVNAMANVHDDNIDIANDYISVPDNAIRQKISNEIVGNPAGRTRVRRPIIST